MANRRQRRRRRERRHARVVYPTVFRYLAHCRAPDGSGVNHWIYLTTKGDILFRDHLHADVKTMAAEALLLDAEHGCHGCYWFAARVVHDEDFLKTRFSLRDCSAFNRREKAEISHNLILKLRDKLLTTRSKHSYTHNALNNAMMRPLPTSLIYRRELVKARRGYWIDALALRVQKRMEIYKSSPDPGSFGSEFGVHFDTYDLKSEYGRDQCVYTWDY